MGIVSFFSKKLDPYLDVSFDTPLSLPAAATAAAAKGGAAASPRRGGLREATIWLEPSRETRAGGRRRKFSLTVFLSSPKISPKKSAPLVDPPSRLAAAYRPLSGPYSSRDPTTVRAHLQSLAAAGVGGVLTYCSAPTVAAVEPSKAAVKQGLVAKAASVSSSSASRSASSTTTAAVGRQLLQQQQQQPKAATTATAASSSSSSSSVRIVPAERPTNASALANLVTQAAVLGLGVGFLVPEYRHRNARTVRDDLRWCLEVAQGAVKSSAAARGALAARSPAARRAQPLAPLLSHKGKAVFLVKSAASIPCHHWTALLKPGGAFSVREGEKGGSGQTEAKKKATAAAKGTLKKEEKGREEEGAAAVAGAGAVSGRRSLLVASSAFSSSSSSSSGASSSSTAAGGQGKTTVKSAFSSSSSSASASPDPISLDGFWFAEWRDRDDGDVAASCGFDGVATAPGDDGADASDASAAENDKVEPVPFGAEPGNWPAMRARARRQGLAFLSTVSPGSDATPVRPWSASKVRFLFRSAFSFVFFLLSLSFSSSSAISKMKKIIPQVRSREPGGARYSRLWRYAALSGPDAVVVDSFNGWNEGTQIEAAAAKAAGCGGEESESGDGEKEEMDGEKSSSSSAATALGPQCAPDVRSYAEGEEAAAAGGLSSSSSSSSSSRENKSRQQKQKQQKATTTPHLYMRLTARAAAVATRARRSYELPRALASQLEARRRPSE